MEGRKRLRTYVTRKSPFTAYSGQLFILGPRYRYERLLLLTI